MKQAQGIIAGRTARSVGSQRIPRSHPVGAPVPRVVRARVLIRPARPDDLEEASVVEQRIWGRMAASLTEMQRRLFALPEAFLLAELRRPGHPRQIVGLANGLIWTREFPRSYSQYEKMIPSSSHNPRGDVLYMATLGVNPALRGHGVGLRVLQEAIVVARRRHLKVIRLIANHRSQPLYARAGFSVVRPLPRIYRQFRDLMPQPSLMEIVLG